MRRSDVLRVLVLGSVLLAACAAPPAESDIADPGDPEDEAAALGSAQTVAGTPGCAATDKALFFHGLEGYGREIRTTGLCAPSIAQFWGDVAFAKAPAAKVVGGYSAGRVPLLRRLAKATSGGEEVAVMLDGSWADGRRYQGKTGPEIVDAWLDGDAARRFVLVYLEPSAGWREYMALASGPHADQIQTCAVRGMSHVDLPGFVTADLFFDPDAWLAARCSTGLASQ